MKFPYQLIELTHTLDETSPSWEKNCDFSSSIVLDYAGEQLTSKGSFVMAFPLKIRQTTEAPMRLIGLLP